MQVSLKKITKTTRSDSVDLHGQVLAAAVTHSHVNFGMLQIEHEFV